MDIFVFDNSMNIFSRKQKGSNATVNKLFRSLTQKQNQSVLRRQISAQMKRMEPIEIAKIYVKSAYTPKTFLTEIKRAIIEVAQKLHLIPEKEIHEEMAYFGIEEHKEEEQLEETIDQPGKEEVKLDNADLHPENQITLPQIDVKEEKKIPASEKQMPEKQPIVVSEGQLTKREKLIASKIVARLKANQQRLIQKRYQRMVKRARYRKNVIMELVKTEEGYVQDLALVSEKIIASLKEQKILSNDEISVMFSNIGILQALNKQLLEDLKARSKELGPYTKIADLMIQFAPYFKMYQDYLTNYQKADELMSSLKEKNKRFAEFCASMQKNKEYRFLNISDFIVKPVQRLPKYVLLLKDLLKNTDEDHPDFAQISKAFEMYNKVNADNNASMFRASQNSQLFKLQKLFPEAMILDGRREFLFELEHPTSVLVFPKMVPAVVYFLNDALLVAEKRSLKLVSFLTLTSASYCRQVPDFPSFKNGFMILSASDSVVLASEQRTAVVAKVEEVIEGVIHREQQFKLQRSELRRSLSGPIKHFVPIIVEVVAVRTRQLNVFATKQVFVIEITANECPQRLFLTLKDCLKLQELVRKELPHIKLTLPDLQEDRQVQEMQALLLEGFFVNLLLSIQDEEKGPIVLEKMGLPRSLFRRELARSLSTRKSLSPEKNPKCIMVNSLWQLPVTESTRIQELFEQLAVKTHTSWDDFRFHSQDKLLDIHENALEANEKRQLQLKKCLFLPQESLAQVKLEQLYNQLVLDIKNGVLLYDTRQYKSLCSVYLALKNITGKVSLDNCLDLIPAGILKSAKKDHFIKEVSETLHKLEMFFSENSSFKKFRIGQLAFQKIAARSAFYGMKLFQVEFPKDFHMIFEGHYLLGVNYQGLSVIDRKSREVLESVDWTTINRMNVFCNLLMVDRKDSLSLKMICQSGFLLKGLADDYKFYQAEQEVGETEGIEQLMNLLTDNESSRASFDLEIDINSILEWSEVDQIDVLAEQYRMKRRK